MGFHEIKPGYVSRWTRQTIALLGRGVELNLMAIAAIIAVFFFVPQWGGMSLLSGYLLLTLLISIASHLDGHQDMITSLKRLLPGTLKLIVFFLAFDIVFTFFASGAATNLTDPDQSVFFAIDRAAFEAFGSLSTNLEMATQYPDEIMQNPLMPMLVYIGGSRGILPGLSLEYLVTLSMAFMAIMRNFAPTVLLIIIAEFVLRSQTVFGTALSLHHDLMTQIVCAGLMGAITWIGSIWMYFYLREMVDGESGVGKKPCKRTPFTRFSEA